MIFNRRRLRQKFAAAELLSSPMTKTRRCRCLPLPKNPPLPPPHKTKRT
jgi:hypothetical protein